MKVYATKQEVMSIPAPEFTASWHPIPHSNVVDTINSVLEECQIGVLQERFSLTQHGNRMFGVWLLDIGNDTKLQLGARNAIDKSMALGLCAGTRVIVCSNMMFSGNFVEFRRHTSGLVQEELLELTKRAISQIIIDGYFILGWQNQLKDFPLSQDDIKILTYDAISEGIIPPSNFRSFVDCYAEEIKLAKDSTLYQFHGAVTRFYRDKSLFSVADRTRELTALCDKHIANH